MEFGNDLGALAADLELLALAGSFADPGNAVRMDSITPALSVTRPGTIICLARFVFLRCGDARNVR